MHNGGKSDIPESADKQRLFASSAYIRVPELLLPPEGSLI